MSLRPQQLLAPPEPSKKLLAVAAEINSILHEPGRVTPRTIIAAYVLYKARISTAPFTLSAQRLTDGSLNLDEDMAAIIREELHPRRWEQLEELLIKCEPKTFAGCVMLSLTEMESFEHTSPDSIVRLAQRILDCRSGEHVADICAGVGSFLNSTAALCPEGSYAGFDINVCSYCIAKMRAELLEVDVDYHLNNAFRLTTACGGAQTFDKVFANYPFLMRLKHWGIGSDYLRLLQDKIPGLSVGTSSDWLFNMLVTQILSEKGKAVAIMANGSTWNAVDVPMRKHFVESGLLECVISLPEKMLGYTSIATTLVVLSHGNKNVRMIDATGMCKQGRRYNEFDEDDIENIIHSMNADSASSKTLTPEELRANEYILNPRRYLGYTPNFENGVQFGTIVKSLSRGIPSTAKQLDELHSDEPTDTQYLKLADIQEGVIAKDLAYLTHCAPGHEKHCLKNNALVLSKHGLPYKVAIASVKEGQHIIANGNLYIIELDEEKVEPLYIKAFFESETGVAALNSIAVGSVAPSIGQESLKKLQVPLPPRDVQERIALRYRATLDEIAMLKLRQEKAKNRLLHIFDVEMEGAVRA